MYLAPMADSFDLLIPDFFKSTSHVAVAVSLDRICRVALYVMYFLS